MFHVDGDVDDAETTLLEPAENAVREEPEALTLRERVFVFFSFERDTIFRENPNVFLGAALYQLLHVLVITLSIAVLLVDSAPKFYALDYGEKIPINVVEAVVIAFFIFDYVIRLCSAPHRLRFVVYPLNIIDLLVILPYFITLGVELGLGVSFGANALVRVIRVARLMRFGRWSGLLIAIVRGMKRGGVSALFLLVFLFVLAMVFSSALLFFSEQTVSSFSANRTWVYEKTGSPTPFQSIYVTFWWALITLTFLGEGTVAPQSVLGQAVAALTIGLGLVSFAIPAALMIRCVIDEVNIYTKEFSWRARIAR